MTQFVLGFYNSKGLQSEILKKLSEKKFHHSAVLCKDRFGRVIIHENKPSLLVWGMGLIVWIYVLLAIPTWLLAPATVVSLFFAGLLVLKKTNRVNRQLLDQYSRWVLEEEMLVLVQTSAEDTNQVLDVLQSIGNSQPATFVVRQEVTTDHEAFRETVQHEPLVTDLLRQHAADLAATHHVSPSTGQRQPFLNRLSESERVLDVVQHDLAKAAELEQRITPAAEWLLDNAYVIQGHINDIRRNLPRRYYKDLPILTTETQAQDLRIHRLAEELVAQTDGKLNRVNITDFLQSYQNISPLTMGELWVFPLFLRVALIEELRQRAIQVNHRQHEREQADFWANRLLNAARRDPDQLLYMLAELAKVHSDLPPHFVVRLIGHLYGEETVLSAVQGWLEHKLKAPLQEILRQEQARQALYQLSIANAIKSLRQLAQLDWRDVFEEASCVERVLRQDPLGAYSHCDFTTRDRCRHAVEEMALHAKVPEIEVAQKAIELASRVHFSAQERCRHVGYYLIAGGRENLELQLHCQLPRVLRLRRCVVRNATSAYLLTVGFITAFMVTILLTLAAQNGASLPSLVLLMAIALFPASELSIQLVGTLVRLLLPPRIMPKLSFEEGIPPDCSTMVVVPMMLFTKDSIGDEVEKLEIRYLANPDPNLCFALISDFADAPKPHMPEDQELLEVAIRGIKKLNTKYEKRRFFLFHRPRRWCQTQQCWMGWERKRGKLEELNAYLSGERSQDLLIVGERASLGAIQFVITLDADTQLPHDTARRLVEAIAHPLNRPRLSPDGRSVVEGYSIIQPRVSTSLPGATATLFTRLFTDPRGTDPYAQAVSDVYQDLFGEGIFHGKAIYDVKAFQRVLGYRFPEGTLLSHDLIEGVHVGVGYASDIELFEQFPLNYQAFVKRQHRWVRGDWQIASWVLRKVPAPDGGKQPTLLSTISRWKIFDNLRRSLVSAASILLLVVSWLRFPGETIWSLLVGLMLVYRVLEPLPVRLVQSLRGTKGLWSEQARDLVRAVVSVALMPHQALLSLDAMGRVAFRHWVSHRRLLEWESAQVAHWRAAGGFTRCIIHMAGVTLGTVVLTTILVQIHFAAWPSALPFLVLWLLSPAIVDWMNGPKRQRRKPALAEGDRRYLRQIACQTWRFFDDFVGPQTHWLPPDNSQESLRIEVAQRTSPTNIGLWMISALAARDFGYLTADQMIERVLATLETLDRLEKFEGHLLNWYDTQTLQPLRPPYVSTVDSGNLLASLWVLEQGCHDGMTEPILRPAILQGLGNRLDLLHRLLDPESLKGGVIKDAMVTLGYLFKKPPDQLQTLVQRLRQSVEPAKRLTQALRSTLPAEDDRVYWAHRINESVLAWTAIVDRYLHWFEILANLSKEELQKLSIPALLEWRNHLQQAPSLEALAQGKGDVLEELLELSVRSVHRLEWGLRTRMDEIAQAYSNARRAAIEMAEQTQVLIRYARRLGEGINIRFLYDAERRLFTIGFNVSSNSRDTSYYDLLASEARLASLVAIARGDVPAEHWMALGRPYATGDGQLVLLSWSGTIFEYLMPLLLTRTFENSLLDYACQVAVTRQVNYGRRRGIPWGISESAFSALDAHRIYQYRAFGVPGLGLKRGLEDDLVVAPYATFLALTVDPLAALRNLKRLARIGMRGSKGFYESIDYTRQRRPEGERGVIIYAYMAHHQAMSLLALDNALNDGVMQRRFHADLRVRAAEPLFFERIPTTPSDHLGPSPERPQIRMINALPSADATRINTENTPVPRVHLLSNGAYAVMITNSGGGYSRWRDFDLTRWRADTTRDAWGSFCYIRDVERDVKWSTTFHPLDRPERRYSATFSGDRVEFRRRDAEIETTSEVVVSPEDDAEIRRITFTNISSQTRRLELTSYTELALAPHTADRIHPAFNKLFIQTEAWAEHNALLAWRRPRALEDPPIFAGHVLSASDAFEGLLQYETDRAAFIGRGRGLENPIALEGTLSNGIGAVLDPIFSLRRTVVLSPGQKVRLAFVTLAGETRERVQALVEKYRELTATNRALEMAWTHAQLELRYLGIQADEAQRFQELAVHMIYPNAQLRPAAERLRRNALGQARLWAYGISGDLPILTVIVGDTHDLGVVREALLAHTYWRVRGLKADLVILSKEPISYEQPLRTQLAQLIQVHSLHTGIDRPGGVFLRSIEQIPDEDLTLLLASARVVLVAARGSLGQQLIGRAEASELPPPFKINNEFTEEASAPLPFLELPYFNGLGGFTPDGREYAIYLGPGDQTPAPWVNVMANRKFGALVSESGPGFLWHGNSQTNRQTPWLNDPVSTAVSEAIYVRDEQSGAVWSPTALPIREQDAYRARHGQGYTVFEHNSHSIEQELITFVPLDAQGGSPLRVQRLRLRNGSSRFRRLSVTTYAEWSLGTDREETQLHIITNWDGDCQALMARNRYHPEFNKHVAFATLSPVAHSFTADRTEFLGRNGSAIRPAALGRQRLSGRVGAGLDPCAALQVEVHLQPGASIVVIYVLGQANDVAEARALAQRYQDVDFVAESLAATRNWWDQLLGVIQVETPDLAVNFMLNRWLLYQTLSCRIWGRSAFYQSGGAFGFRDQLQDVMALVYAAPQLAREHILRAASRQFIEGDVQHWWHPPSGAGIRSRCSDDLLWLPFVTARYVRVTGDVSILDLRVPFLEGRPLEEHEHEVYLLPTPAMEDGTLFEHCWRAIKKGSTRGPHGLPLIGTGDWNDGMNRVGHGGKGESIWLAWFLIDVLNHFVELCDVRGEKSMQDFCREHIHELTRAAESHGWDGGWYRRAYFDDGTPLGSKESEEACLDSLPQSWAAISGLADEARTDQALRATEEFLVREADRMILVYTPPFERSQPHPGYIMGYPPGVRENGGQYTHAAIWLAMAFARRGQGRRAVELLSYLNPVEHARTPDDVARYRGEPYVIAADISALEGKVGRSGWTWYTGSSGWMYRVWLEEVLGFKLRGDTLIVDPVIPPEWKRFSLHYRHRNTLYKILVDNSTQAGRGVAWVEVDGKRLPGLQISLLDDRVQHEVKIFLDGSGKKVFEDFATEVAQNNPSRFY